MAKKAERKAREEAERRVSGVPVRSEVQAPPASSSGKDAKRALRAARPAKAAPEGAAKSD